MKTLIATPADNLVSAKYLNERKFGIFVPATPN